MRKWTERPIDVASLVFFDLETSGLRPDRGARITEVAVIDSTSIRHVWTTDHFPPSDSVVAQQCRLLWRHFGETVVIGHNLQFDFAFLAHEADRLNLDGPRVRVIDTLDLTRRLLNPADARLEVLARRIDFVPEENFHTALGDARATRALFWALVESHELTTLSEAGIKHLRWSRF